KAPIYDGEDAPVVDARRFHPKPNGGVALRRSRGDIVSVAAPDKEQVVHAAILSAVIVLIGYLIVLLVVPGPPKPFVLKEGIAMFGLFVLAAQAIERLIEPFTALDGTMKEAIKHRDTKCAEAVTNPNQDTASEAAKSQAKVDEKKIGRTFFWWAVATVIGLI